jgi:hypothetical protein
MDLPWNGDLSKTASGDIAIVSGGSKVFQRVVRRFLTNAQQTDSIGRVINLPDYLFHPKYGGNARQVIDNPLSTQGAQNLQQRFAAQATAENGVAQDPACQLNINSTGPVVTMNTVIYLADSVTPTVGSVSLS